MFKLYIYLYICNAHAINMFKSSHLCFNWVSIESKSTKIFLKYLKKNTCALHVQVIKISKFLFIKYIILIF